MKFSKEVKTGIIALAAIALFIWGFNYLKGKKIFSTARTFYTLYDNVEGLAPETNVTINGIVVGRVERISFLDQKGKVIVCFTIENDFEFSSNSKAKIYGGGLLGGKSIAVVPVNDGAPVARSGDTISGYVEPGMLELVNKTLAPLQQKVENMIINVDSLMRGLNDILTPQTKKNLTQAMARLNRSMAHFEKASKSIDQLLTDNKDQIGQVTKNLNTVSTNIASLSDTLLKANIGMSVRKIQKTLTRFDSLLSGLERGEGTLGKFLKDKALYDNLREASHELHELLEDVKINPKRYVHFSIFGRTPVYVEKKTTKKTNPEETKLKK